MQTDDTSRSELALMQGVARGDAASIARLYDQYGRFVYRQAYLMFPRKGEAEDVVQDVFVQLWQTASAFDPERSRLISWVALMTRRLLIDKLRAARSRPKLHSMPEESGSGDWGPAVPPEPQASDFEDSSLRRRLRNLPASQRSVLEAVYLQGKTIREAADALGIPRGTVKSALSRGLEALRRGSSAESLG